MTPTPSEETNDLAKQYQDILDHYAKDLAVDPATPPVTPPVVNDVDLSSLIPSTLPPRPPIESPLDDGPTSTPDPDAKADIPPAFNPPLPQDVPEPSAIEPEPLPAVEEPAVLEAVKPSEPPVSIPEPIVLPVEPPVESVPTTFNPPPRMPVVETPIMPEILDTPISAEANPVSIAPTTITDLPPVNTTPSGSNVFKYLFFVSLLIFLGVAGAVAYTVINNSSASTPTTVKPTISQVNSAVSPTVDPSKICQVNDKQYKIGESFKGKDGCNTCTCQSDLTISCTDLACSTKTASPSATMTAKTPAEVLAAVNKALKTAFKPVVVTAADATISGVPAGSQKLDLKILAKTEVATVRQVLAKYGFTLNPSSAAESSGWTETYTSASLSCIFQGGAAGDSLTCSLKN